MEKTEDVVMMNRGHTGPLDSREDSSVRDTGHFKVGHETRQKTLFERLKGNKTLIEEESNRREEEWKKREEEMIERLLRFVVTEPEEPTLSGEWKKREEEMRERMLRLLVTEPEEPTLSGLSRSMDLEDAWSMDHPPSMSGGTPSETGSLFSWSTDEVSSSRCGSIAPSSGYDSMSQASTDDKVPLIKKIFRRLKGKRTLTEEDWNRRQEQWRRREQEMIDRMLEFVDMEPEEPSLPAVRRSNSMDLSPPSREAEVLYKADETFSSSVNTEHKTYEYSSKLPEAGLSHCNVTGLMFKTTGEAEVLYKADEWDEEQLQSTAGTPAGPLYDIKCPQGSVSQLHLPHCEVTSVDDPSVAHISDEEPHVTHPSKFGLWWKSISKLLKPRLPYCQVLLFLRPPSDRLVMKVFLLPGNVLIEEVMSKIYNREDKYIDCPSICHLAPKTVYSLHCPTHVVQPKASKPYRLNYGPNYHPTFEVMMDLNTEVVSLELRDPKKKPVWTHSLNLSIKGQIEPTRIMNPRLSYPDGVSTDQPSLTEEKAAEKLKSVRTEFIQRVSEATLKSLLDVLLQNNVINDGEMESVTGEILRLDKARLLIDTVKRKGEKACSKMIEVIHQLDPYLITSASGGTPSETNRLLPDKVSDWRLKRPPGSIVSSSGVYTMSEAPTQTDTDVMSALCENMSSEEEEDEDSEDCMNMMKMMEIESGEEELKKTDLDDYDNDEVYLGSCCEKCQHVQQSYGDELIIPEKLSRGRLQ